MCLYVLSELDMRVRSEVWAAANSRLEELLTFLNSDSAEPETTQTSSALEGLALILHLAALYSSPTRYRTSTRSCCHSSFLFLRSSHRFSVNSPSPLLWVPAETLGRALKSCQIVLEGNSQAVTNQTYFQSAVQITVRVLDSILYLTSKDRH